MTTRRAELERLAARVELELQAEYAARRERERMTVIRPGTPGRPARIRGDDDHGTETDYQAEHYAWRHKGQPPPCELCKAAHRLHNRRKDRARRLAKARQEGAA